MNYHMYRTPVPYRGQGHLLLPSKSNDSVMTIMAATDDIRLSRRGRKDGPSSQPLSPRSPEKKIKQPTSPRFAALEDSSSGNGKPLK